MREQGKKRTEQKNFLVFRAIGTWFLWFALSLCVLMLLLWASSCIPKQAIRKNLLKSAEYLLEEEELFYQQKEGDRRTEIHNYADATTLNILYSIGEENSFSEILISPFYSDHVNEEKTVTELLVERIVEEETADTLYDRYWHGMILLLRPLFLLFTIQGIRWLFLGVLGAMFLVLVVLLIRKKQVTAAVLLVLAATLVQLPMTAFCMEYVPTILIMLGSSVAVVLRPQDRDSVLRLCAVTGVCTAFFDFLTTETLTVVIPLALVYGIWSKEGRLKSIWEELKFLLEAGTFWGASYVGSYFVKWTLSGIVLGENRWPVAIASFLGRQGDAVISFALDSLIHGSELPKEAVLKAGGDLLPQPVSAVMINIRLLLGLSGKITLEHLALLLVFAAAGMGCILYLYKKKEVGVLPAVLFLLGAIPILRMMVLHNHSTVHCFFVYRALLGTIFCFMTAFTEMIDWSRGQRRKSRR